MGVVTATRSRAVFTWAATLSDKLLGRSVVSGRGGQPARPREATFHRMRDAEQFLDLLENLSVGGRELVVKGKSTYLVRWRS